MPRGAWTAAVLVGLLGSGAGCAPHREPGVSSPASGQAVSDAARRIYWLAEAQYQRGNYPAAVGLWTHALLQLPQTAAADDVRHQLVLRIGYGRLAASVTSGAPEHAHAGITMLERYLAKHEALFGDGPEARAQRGEVYELLYALETEAAPEPEPEPETEASPAEVDDDTIDAEPVTPTAAADVEAETVDEAVGDDGELVRKVHVAKRPRVDPVRARVLLESSVTDAAEGLVFTQPGIVPLHGPRPLLRLRSAAWSRPDQRTRARPAARAIIDIARPELLSCYVDALGRAGDEDVTLALTLQRVDDGSIRARIRDGMLVDGWGDICVAETFAALDLDLPRDLDVQLQFFVEGALMVREWDGRALRDDLELAADAMTRTAPQKPTAPVRGLPTIDVFGG